MQCPICNNPIDDDVTYDGSTIVEYLSTCNKGHFHEHSYYGYIEIYIGGIELRFWYEDNKELFQNFTRRELWSRVYDFAVSETKKKYALNKNHATIDGKIVNIEDKIEQDGDANE